MHAGSRDSFFQLNRVMFMSYGEGSRERERVLKTERKKKKDKKGNNIWSKSSEET